MKRLKELWNRFVRLCLPTYRSKVVAILIVGVGAGLGVYLTYMSMVWNYAGSDPKTCVQCHVMEPYYATWQHSSHSQRAQCADCHVPHNNILNYYYTKGSDGLRHATVFTARREPQVMRTVARSQRVIYDNCVRCHTQLNQDFVKTGMLTRSEINDGSEKRCWDCHRDVPHGGSNSLSSTPHALVPFPDSPVPQWLKALQKK
ncbi:cytochrome c nitrite reductase small subunit [uncultured Porphyromonas sp.]|uniref:cytochrome c nitrite reductase small subunit n=1 Tax=uncultured Porphyromonas sp. TaxID=159274 RepID=UPI002632C8F5|nr:cytochrome c nitrite reductase small subunit [uncultured Porphyromonas sp.]